jgi:hypothetical protein
MAKRRCSLLRRAVQNSPVPIVPYGRSTPPNFLLCVVLNPSTTPARKRKNRKLWGAVAFVTAASLAIGGLWLVRGAESTRLTLGEVTATLPDIPLALVKTAEAPEPETDEGPYLGFDTYKYPGFDALKAWKRAGKYKWVGFYLPAPCHKDDSWSGRRTTLENMGWGVAVIYVGQQTWGKRTKPTARTGSSNLCAASLVNGVRGRKDANDAIARTAAEGFPHGTVIFLDIERMDKTPRAMRDYYSAWTRRVIDDGRYRPGYYVHTRNAERVYADVKRVFRLMGVNHEPSFWVAGGSGFAPHKDPQDVGHTFAVAWQGILDIVERHNSVRLPIDVNVAALPSPSSHAFAPKGDD